MFEHVNATCAEGNGSWLPLIEYSVKTGVSLSTIRRKIKSNRIQYRLEKGRYLILLPDSDQTTSSLNTSTIPAEELETDDSVRMVSEAFEFALREKDERIRSLEKRNRELEDRLNELRLLVQVLEEKYEVRY